MPPVYLVSMPIRGPMKTEVMLVRALVALAKRNVLDETDKMFNE
jgi:hypothetical protein